MRYKDIYLMDACIRIPCLNVLSKGRRRQNTYKSKNGSIYKKELVVRLEKINSQLPALGLENNTPNGNTPYNSKKFPNHKERDSQKKKIYNKEVGLSHIIPEKQPLLNGMTNVVNTELDSSSDFLDNTILNLDSLCQSETPVLFWYNDELEPIPILEVSHEDNFVPSFNLNTANPVLTQSRMPTNNSSATIDLELTPPSSTTCDSIISVSSSDSEDYFCENFVYLESPNQKSVQNIAGEDDILRKQVEVPIEDFQPSLRQLQDVYRRTKTKRVNNPTNFRERRLRPSNSLRQFTPFMIEAPLQKKHGKNSHKKHGKNSHKKHGKNSHKKHSTGRINTRDSCQTQLFLNAKQDQLKLELQQKKQAMNFRKQFENALDSINKRIFRQSHFWKMLPT